MSAANILATTIQQNRIHPKACHKKRKRIRKKKTRCIKMGCQKTYFYEWNKWDFRLLLIGISFTCFTMVLSSAHESIMDGNMTVWMEKQTSIQDLLGVQLLKNSCRLKSCSNYTSCTILPYTLEMKGNMMKTNDHLDIGTVDGIIFRFKYNAFPVPNSEMILHMIICELGLWNALYFG